MPQLIKHKAWLGFLRKVIDVPLGFSKEDLWSFRNLALREHSAIVPLIEEYLRLAENSETGVHPQAIEMRNTARKAAQMHLFDLLREKTFFPRNLDLARFASRVLPQLKTYRFDKMSRSDIAARIIEYLESTDLRSRDTLEESMRDALKAMKRGSTTETDRRSFLSKWEKIIKGIEL